MADWYIGIHMTNKLLHSVNNVKSSRICICQSAVYINILKTTTS